MKNLTKWHFIYNVSYHFLIDWWPSRNCADDDDDDDNNNNDSHNSCCCGGGYGCSTAK